MEPLSAAASILGLLTVAGESCKFLFTFFHSFSDAPADIKSQYALIRSLQTTFANLNTLYANLPTSDQFNHELAARTTDFLEMVKIVERKIRVSNAMLSRGMMHRIWARTKWSLAADRWLRMFFDDLRHWNIVFSNELAAAQLKLLIKIEAQTSIIGFSSNAAFLPHLAKDERMRYSDDLLVAQPLEVCAAGKSPHITCGTGVSTCNRPKSTRFAGFIRDFAEPMELRTWFWHQFEGKAFFLALRCGPTIVRRWSPDGREIFQVLSLTESFSIAITFQVAWFFPSRISLMVSGLSRFRKLASLSLQSILKFSRLVPNNASSFNVIRGGDPETLRALLDLGEASTSDVVTSGDTLLHVATRENRKSMVSVLLSKGADANAANNLGETPLHTALNENSDYDISRLLIENGADPNRLDLDGRTPLHCFFNPSTQNILSSFDADIDRDIQDDRGMTVLHYTAWTSRSTRRDVDRYLKGSRMHSLAKDYMGRSILHLAAQRGNLDLIRYFLGQSFSTALQLPDCFGRTPMHYATESSRVEALNILFQHGFDVHAVDHGGRTVLHHAAAKGNVEAAKRLIQLGAKCDLLVTDNDNMTPAKLASASGAMSVARYLEPTDDNTLQSEIVKAPNEGPRTWLIRMKRVQAYCAIIRLRLQWKLPLFIILFIWYLIPCSSSNSSEAF